jgi:hypothetical protein
MNRKWISSIFLPLAGMICTLAFAYGCSLFNQAIQAHNNIAFDLYLVLPWSYVLTTFLSSAATIFLFWIIMTRTSRSKLTGWVFLVVGALLILFPIVFFYILTVVHTINWIIPPYLIDTAPDSLLYITEVEVALIGLFILILPRSPSIDRDDRIPKPNQL